LRFIVVSPYEFKNGAYKNRPGPCGRGAFDHDGIMPTSASQINNKICNAGKGLACQSRAPAYIPPTFSAIQAKQ